MYRTCLQIDWERSGGCSGFAAVALPSFFLVNQIIGTGAGLMATNPTRILVRQMIGAVAQCEKSQIVLKLRGARMRQTRTLRRPQAVRVLRGRYQSAGPDQGTTCRGIGL